MVEQRTYFVQPQTEQLFTFLSFQDPLKEIMERFNRLGRNKYGYFQKQKEKGEELKT